MKSSSLNLRRVFPFCIAVACRSRSLLECSWSCFSWKTIAAYVNEICVLFGCDLEDLGYTLKIGSSLAQCFRTLHEIEHVEEQAKVGSHYYLQQRMRLLWLSVRNSKR